MKTIPLFRDTKLNDLYAIAPVNSLMGLFELGEGFKLDRTPSSDRRMTAQLYYRQRTWFYFRQDSVRQILKTDKLTTVGEVWLLYLACKRDNELNNIVLSDMDRSDYATIWDRFKEVRFWKVTEPKYSVGDIWVFEKVTTPENECTLPLGKYLDSVGRMVVDVGVNEIRKYTYNGLDIAGTFGNWFNNLRPVTSGIRSVTQPTMSMPSTPEDTNPILELEGKELTLPKGGRETRSVVGAIGLSEDTLINDEVLIPLLRQSADLTVTFKVTRHGNRFQLLVWDRPAVEGELYLCIYRNSVRFFTFVDRVLHPGDVYKSISTSDRLSDVWSWFRSVKKPPNKSSVPDQVFLKSIKETAAVHVKITTDRISTQPTKNVCQPISRIVGDEKLDEFVICENALYDFSTLWDFIEPGETWKIEPYYKNTLAVKCSVVKALSEYHEHGYYITKDHAAKTLRITEVENIIVKTFEHRAGLQFGTMLEWINGLRFTGKVEQFHLSEVQPHAVVESTESWQLTALDTTKSTLTAVSGSYVLEAYPSAGNTRLIELIVKRNGSVLSSVRLSLEQLDGLDIIIADTTLQIGRITVDLSKGYPELTLI